MKVARLAVGMLETESAFAEIDLARDAGVNHPLQCAVDRGAADALIFASNEIDEIVGAEVTFLAQEHIDDLFPFAGTLAAIALQAAEIRKVAVQLDPPPFAVGAPTTREARRADRSGPRF